MKTRHTWSWRWLLFVPVLLTVAFGARQAMAQEEQASRCPGATEAPPPTVRPAGELSRLQERSVQFAFGGGRNLSDRTVGIDANPALTAQSTIFAELAGDLERGDGGDSFPVEGIVVRTVTTPSGNLRLTTCLDPSQPESVEPGRYVGTVKLTGPQIQPTAITLEATLRRSELFAVIVLLAGLAIGFVVKGLGDKKAAQQTVEAAAATMRAAGAENVPSPKLPKFWGDYVKSGAFWSSVVAAALAAVLAFSQIYMSDPDWGTFLDVITLGFAGIASVVSGKAVVDVVAPYVPTMPK
jgi:hypothetical protein